MAIEWLGYLLTGAASAAFIKLVDNVIQWKLARKAKKEDKAEEQAESNEKAEWERIKSIEADLKSVIEGQRYILLDRIRYLGLAYLKNGEISFDDRRLLHQMHSVYHDALHGNGDLDELMSEVDELPLKQ